MKRSTVLSHSNYNYRSDLYFTEASTFLSAYFTLRTFVIIILSRAKVIGKFLSQMSVTA